MNDLRTPATYDDDLFATRVREYALEHPLQQRLQVLEAGCGLGDGLALGELDRHTTGVDVDRPDLRAHTRERRDLDAWVLGDLRTAPLPPRTYDVVHAPYLLERIRNAELILDRFVAALKPGGLLLLRFRDRGSAYGFLDRILPDYLKDRTGEPIPMIYEQVTAYRTLRWYTVMRGLIIADEYTSREKLDSLGAWRSAAGTACRMLAVLTRGRLSAAHSEVTLVIRKPENRYARLL